MAFQIPLMRNDYDIYKMNKSRAIATGKKSNGRSRNVSESHSYSTSPGQNDPFIGSPSHRNLQHVQSAGGRFNNFSRVNSRTSQSSLIMSPTRSHSVNNPSPPKPVTKSNSQTSLNKFHTRLVDKLRRAFKSSSSEESSTRSWKSHSIDLSSPFKRPSEVNRKLVSASSAEIAALERQFQLIQTDSEDENDDVSSDSDEKNHHCDDKFILIWTCVEK